MRVCTLGYDHDLETLLAAGFDPEDLTRLTISVGLDGRDYVSREDLLKAATPQAVRAARPEAVYRASQESHVRPRPFFSGGIVAILRTGLS